MTEKIQSTIPLTRIRSFGLPFLALLTCAAVQAQTPAPQALRAAAANPLAVFPSDRLTSAINESSWITLSGSVHSQARSANDAGPTPAATPMLRMTLALQRTPEQQAALDAFSAAVQDPSSPLYHKWLTPQEFGSHFGLTQNDLDRVSAWLTSKGFTIDDIPSGRWTIVFSGTVAQVQSAFHTSIHNYTLRNRTFFANSNDPQVPQSLDGMILGIDGLNNFPMAHGPSPNLPEAVTNAGAHFLDPVDFYTIYDVVPLFQKGLSGNGVNIAAIESCTMDISLAGTYWSLEGVGSQGFWYTDYGTPATCSSDESGEVYLDIEWAQNLAQGAKVWLAAGQGNDPIFNAIQNAVSNGLFGNAFPAVLTVSYSTCGNPTSYVQMVNSVFQQAHSQGISALVASGDWGAAACDANDPASQLSASHGLAINDNCQSLYVTCVGGTEFNDFANPGQFWNSNGHAVGYIPEIVWNETNDTLIKGATGGGFSTLFAKPPWQTQNPSSFRGVPDIALTAAVHDGYRVCDTASGCNANFIQAIAGTSAAAPSLAGIVALLVQAYGPQGNLNQTMYALAARNDLGLIFHDITSGNNSVAGQNGYSAGQGWDPVTGLGSIDANAFVTNWPNAFAPEAVITANNINLGSEPVGKTTAAQTITITNQSVAPNLSGAAATLTISSVKLGGNNPGDFPSTTNCITATLNAGGTCTITVTFDPTTTGARSATITVVDNSPNSPHLITLTGTGGSGSAAPTITSLSPSSANAGAPAFQLTVNGANFASGAVVQWNGANLPTIFSSTTLLFASVGANLIATAGTASITVSSGGEVSGPATFTINSGSAPGLTVGTKLTSNANGIVNNACVVPPAVTSFTPSSPLVWIYFTVSGATVGDKAIINFIRPDGTVNFSASATAGFTNDCFSYAMSISGTQAATFLGTWTVQVLWNNAPLFSLNFTLSNTSASNGNYFVPVTPCRLVDTRNAAGSFGGPSIFGGSSRNFPIPASPCGIPSTATAYSLNVTVVPHGSLGYLTIWPAGQSQPGVSTLNSLDGRIKANAAIVPAGSNGAVSVFVTDTTDVILDINGYFVPASTQGSLALYPVTPCRVADTRNASGSLGGPSLAGGASRTFPILSSSCGVPSNAQAYSMNFTAVPNGGLGYVTTWPTGQSQPLVSSLNDPTGTIAANAVIVPAGSNGSVDVFASDNTNLVMDINAYFASPGSGLAFYPLAPCRVVDTRVNPGAPVNNGSVNALVSSCGVPSTARALVYNATVVPVGPLGYLTLWPDGQSQPLVSTLNAPDGAITSNMAIVPTTNGLIDLFASPSTNLILDISGYFAPQTASQTETAASIVSPAPGSVLTVPYVTFTISPGTGVSNAAFPYTLAIGTTPGGTDLGAPKPVVPGANPIEFTTNLFNGQPIYVTISTLFNDGTSGSHTAPYTLQSIQEAAIGTYTLSPGNTGEVQSTAFCNGSSPSQPPAVDNFPNASVTIAPGPDGTFSLSMSNVGGDLLPTYTYILTVSQATNDEITFAPGPFGAAQSSYQNGPWVASPTVSGSLTINRTYLGAGDTGQIQLRSTSESSIVFRGLVAASGNSCATVFQDTAIIIDYNKALP